MYNVYTAMRCLLPGYGGTGGVGPRLAASKVAAPHTACVLKTAQAVASVPTFSYVLIHLLAYYLGYRIYHEHIWY